jgi:crotonobetaine/carnitine-CoA ligase
MNILSLENPADRNAGRLLTLQAAEIPDAIAYRTGDASYTFAKANAQVNRYAEGLHRLGVGKGDRVVLFLRSSIEFIFLALATNKLGAVWVPINGDYKGSWLRDAITESRGRVVVSDTSKLPRLREVLSPAECGTLLVNNLDGSELPAGAVDLQSFDSLPAAEPADPGILPGDTSAILWTSGTTGKSKGVLQPHNVWIHAAENIHRQFGTLPGDVVYNCLPLYNTAAWVTAVFRALITGITCALDEHFSATDFWKRVAFYRATETTTLGAMHMFLWNVPPAEGDAANTLRSANVIPLPPRLVKPFMHRFGLQKVQKGYGQSEASTILQCIEDGVKEWKPHALGLPAPGIEVTIRNDAGNECAPGEAGEFCIRPLRQNLLFNGYFGNQEATAKAWHGEWYRTGDLGMRDAEGDFFFLDRKSDFIRDKGRNISSLQVEAAVIQHPAVEAVACFGIPSEHIETESEIKIDVVRKPGQQVSAEELARFVNDNAPYFFVPRYIEFVESLPYTPTNKVQKYKLREKGLTPEVWDRTRSGFELRK